MENITREDIMQKITKEELMILFGITYDHDEFERKVALEVEEEEGRNQAKREIAKNLLKSNLFSMEQIVEITELSVEEINELKKES